MTDQLTVAQIAARTRKLRELCATGYSNAEIADMYGVSKRTVQRWRAMAQIPSTWTPETAAMTHGTPAAARHCDPRCDDCRRALSADTAARQDRYQRESAKTATRYLEPWTDADDAVVMTRPALEAAQLLGRTYAAVRVRRQRINSLNNAVAAALRADTARRRTEATDDAWEAATSR